MTTLQIHTFSPFGEDTAQAVRKAAESATGLQKVYIGRQLENPEHGYYVLQWASGRQPSIDRTPDLVGAGVLKRISSPTTVKITSESEHQIQAVLEAPVQEFAIATLRAPENREQWEHILGLTTEGVRVTEGAIGSIQGLAADDDGRYVLILGWESHEAHMRALGSEYAKDVMKQTLELVDFQVKHAEKVSYDAV
ncbi:hypothetical protein BD626DRAFT_222551 [Schizophyllum amplum]|uniref:Uncharacterized protein n=1 Tax=Schizophyllum amplum TaxID=97359 RepID=A0A550BXK6_9AGAR|nr:hypothetical protein BD626DRAFT_222551 [Auriculariopsis ampla]